MVHNISKLNATDDTQEENLRWLREDICKAESEYSTNNTLIIGELNVNPFEKSCISAAVLHAIPFLQEVMDSCRVVQ